MSSKYTVYGSGIIDTKIESDLDIIRKAVLNIIPDHILAALILGGGYGRGEGGVVFANNTEKTYNDYDFFVFLKNISYTKKKYYQHRLTELHHKLSRQLEIDVDFSPVMAKSIIPRLPFKLMWYELKHGHIVINGDQHILDRAPDYQGNDIPLTEAKNLLLNRASGLILAKERLQNTHLNNSDIEFITRNLMKAITAIGDAYLMSKHNYSYSYCKRAELLKEFQDVPIIKDNNFIDLYNQSIEFKLRPKHDTTDQQELMKKFEYIRTIFSKFYLYIFGQFFNQELSNYDEYLECLENERISTKLIDLTKNIILNLFFDNFKNPKLKIYLKYPRYRLFYAVPFLLFDKAVNNRLLAVLSASNDNEIRDQYFKLWQRFN